MNKEKWPVTKADKELLSYLAAFADFTDTAAPSPEVEIKVKDSGKEFYEKYLKGNNCFLLSVSGSIIHAHCKPRYILRLLELDEVEYIKKVPGIYEPR